MPEVTEEQIAALVDRALSRIKAQRPMNMSMAEQERLMNMVRDEVLGATKGTSLDPAAIVGPLGEKMDRMCTLLAAMAEKGLSTPPQASSLGLKMPSTASALPVPGEGVSSDVLRFLLGGDVKSNVGSVSVPEEKSSGVNDALEGLRKLRGG